MDTNSFTVHVKTDDIYKYITEGIEAMLDTSNFGLDKPSLKGKSKTK